jgi:hypothetical protein
MGDVRQIVTPVTLPGGVGGEAGRRRVRTVNGAAEDSPPA